MTGLTLSTSGISVADEILRACQMQRDELARMDAAYFRRGSPPEYAEDVRQQRYAVRYVTETESMWRSEGRQVLAIHPDLLAEVKMSTSTEIAPEVYRAIPYINPMVVFPDPPVLKSWRPGETMRVLGFFVHGRTDSGDDPIALTSSHDPDMERLCITAVMTVEGAKGGQAYEYNRFSIPLIRALSIEKIVDELAAKYGWMAESSPDLQQAFLREVYSLCLGTILYLCSTVLDAEVVPRSRVAKSSGRRMKPIRLTNIGWNIGPTLSRLRREANASTGAPTGRRLAPHMRKCHFKVVWTGKGRTVPKTAFIAPYWTGRDRLGESRMTMRPVADYRGGSPKKGSA